MAGGLLGVGGGILFVPGPGDLPRTVAAEAVSTSLVAVVLVSIVGTWRQRGYGNVRLRDGLIIGRAVADRRGGGRRVLANAVPERALELSFAAFQLYFAYQLAGRAGLPSWRATR